MMLKSPLELDEAKAAAAICQQCANIIRQWLPVSGTETLSGVDTMDRWHDEAWRLFCDFRTHHPSPGVYHTAGPATMHPLWRELCDGMMAICDHYDWHDVDVDQRRPHSDARGNGGLPEIDGRILSRVEQAAACLHEIENPASDPAIPEPVQLAGARKAIITAMLEADAIDEDRAMTRDAILDAAGYPGGSDAFQSLRTDGYIVGKRGVGSWLSKTGIPVAEANRPISDQSPT